MIRRKIFLSRADKLPHLLAAPHLIAAPFDAVLVPLARSRQFVELRGHPVAEAGERAGDKVVVSGDALFADCGIDAVVCVLVGAPESHPRRCTGDLVCVFGGGIRGSSYIIVHNCLMFVVFGG